MDLRTRKLMTMHKALHPRDNADRLYVSWKEGGRWLTDFENSVDASIQQLKDYTEKPGEGPITATKNNTNTMSNRTTITRKQKWLEKQIYGRFRRLISNTLQEETWTWLRKGTLKRETVSLRIAAQNNAIRTNYIKTGIDKTQQNSK